jgi:hypothetical protein
LFDRANQLALEACGQPITLDVCAAPWNHKCERYITEEQDGLKQDWDANAAWCNPPYSATFIDMFVRKAIEAARHGTTTVCLLPWWNYPYLDLCEQHGRIHRITFPVTFHRQDGTTLTMNNQYRTTPLVLVVFGPTITPGFGTPIRRKEAPAGDGIEVDAASEMPPADKPPADASERGQNPQAYSDEYYTPPEAISILLPFLPKQKVIWECAWGKGHLARYLQEHGHTVVGSPEIDFIEATPLPCDIIVTNPPYSLLFEFIERAYVLGQPFALLLPALSLVRARLLPLFLPRDICFAELP